MKTLCKVLLLVGLVALGPSARAQSQADPETGHRVFSEVGPGFRAIRRGPQGQYYVLVAPNPAVLIFDSTGKKVGSVPAKPEGAAAIAFGAALDVDRSGRVYVADLGGNAVNVYAADGSLLAHVRVPAPMDVAALPGDEFAVADTSGDNLVVVYDLHGARLRAFGELAHLADSPALNRRLNLGHLASDSAGNIYFAFEYMPVPTVRKYDGSGYLADEMSFGRYADVQPGGQVTDQEVPRGKKGAGIPPREIISAIGVDPASQEIWLAFHDELMRFDRDGHTMGGNRTYTAGRARMAPHFILVEGDRLLLGNDPQGIYNFPRAVQDAPGQ